MRIDVTKKLTGESFKRAWLSDLRFSQTRVSFLRIGANSRSRKRKAIL